MASGHQQSDLERILQGVQQLTRQLVEAQRVDRDAGFTGVAGGGLVKATVNGKGKLEHLWISPVAVDPDHVEALEDSVLAAVREAHGAAAARFEAGFEGLADLLPDVTDLTGSSGRPGVQPLKSRYYE